MEEAARLKGLDVRQSEFGVFTRISNGDIEKAV